MLCCQNCNITTEETLTTVVFFSPQNINSAIQSINQKKDRYLAKIQMKSQLKYWQLLNLNKQNQSGNDKQLPQLDQKLKNFEKQEVAQAQSFIIAQDEEGVQTGRFTGKKTNTYMQQLFNSQTKRTMTSKTTSFGSLKNRNSSVIYYKSRQLDIMQNEIQQLKQEQHELRRTKLQQQFAYKGEMLKINQLKKELKLKGKERQIDVLQLKQLLAKRRFKQL